ncbi:unnamed protein product [Effrenium voratum]|nr:unnamed protein product [Effrenium voratum]
MYAKFDHIESGSSSDDSDSATQGPHTEEGLMQAFITLHERRLDLDKDVAMHVDLDLATATCVAPSLVDKVSSAAEAYDDLCLRLLGLDGVSCESALRSFGHRLEVSWCRLAAARLWRACGFLDLAEQRSTEGLACGSDPTEGARAAWGCTSTAPTSLPSLLGALKTRRRDLLMLRASLRLQRGAFDSARADALEAHAAGETTALEMALRCEVAMHGSGPGDGRGLPLTPEEACSLDLTLSRKAALAVDFNSMD